VIVTAGNVHDSTPVDELLAGHADEQVKPTVMGDCAYGTAETLARLADAGYDDVKAKVPPARGRDGRFGKDDFTVDLDAGQITCPAGKVAVIRTGKDGTGRADFAGQCTACPLRDSCTTSASGRTVTIHAREDLLQAPQDRPSHPAMAGGLQRHPPEPRTQDRPLRAPRLGWPQSPCPGQHPYRHRR